MGRHRSRWLAKNDNDLVGWYSRKVACHRRGNALVWQGRGINLYGSGAFHGIQAMPGALHINLGPQTEWSSGYVVQSSGVKIPGLERWAIDEIQVGWDDMQTPPFRENFWHALAQGILQRADQNGGLDVLVFCQGGHGRTGTTLAILLGLWGVQDSIRYVRENYCDSAMETLGQTAYVRSIVPQPDVERMKNHWLFDDLDEYKEAGL